MCCPCMMITIQKMIMKWIGIYVICHFLVQTASHEYGIQLEYERPHNFYNQKQITPLILMVDATNRLGFSILKHHTFHNNNNVAFSPCGLASVLVALFEGSDGHSSFEIYKALDIPFDRDVVRIGYRDIHRRLRSYFYQQENVLSGLSLSKENVTIRSGYESILRFYGYDLGSENSEVNGDMSTTTESKRREHDETENPTTIETTQTTDSFTTIPPTIPTISVKSTQKIVTQPPSTEYYEKVTEVKMETSTFIPPETSTDLPKEYSTETVINTTIQEPEMEIIQSTSTNKPTFSPTTVPPTYPTTVPTSFPTKIPTQLPYVSEITTPFNEATRYPSTRFTYQPTEETTVVPVTEMITSTSKSATHLFTFKPITTTLPPEPMFTSTKRFYNLQTTIPPFTTVRPSDFTIPKALNSFTTIPPFTAGRPSDFTIPKALNQFTTIPPFTTVRPSDFTIPKALNQFTTIPPFTTVRPSDFTIPKALNSLTIPTFTTVRPSDFTIPKALNSLTTVPVPTVIKFNPSEISSARLLNPRNSRVYRVKRDPTTYDQFIPLAPSGYGISSGVDFYDPYFSYATPNPPDFYPEGNPIFATRDFAQSEHHEDEIDHIFYLNPHDTIRIGFKVYNTILRFAYIPTIQASVLELPLDSENYSLMIFVPDQPIEDLVNVLGTHLSPSLRDIRGALRNNWIKTMIPKFQLKGNVVLTGDLMKIGIHDIFEPNKADFSPMTDEFGIYARHIEQSITINIRTHANHQLRRYAQQFFDPIKVPVNRPFVFTIIDNELDLAIMVGRVLNPINSRIL